MAEVRFGVDIGGTKVSAVALDDAGMMTASRWVNHHARDLEDVATVVSDLIDALLAEQSVDRAEAQLGISVAGLVDRHGLVTLEGELSLRQGDVAGAVRRHAGIDGRIVNDAEATLLAAIAADPEGATLGDAALLALGTGIGGAVMWRNQILRGPRGLAGELGHLPVVPPLQYLCVCGASGCLEQMASGRGLAERANWAAARHSADDLLTHAQARPGELTSVHVVGAANAGVGTALQLLDDAATALARAVVTVSVVAEPSKVYIGGSVGHAAADHLIPRIRRAVADSWPFASQSPPPRVDVDAVGPHAAAMGAALLAGLNPAGSGFAPSCLQHNTHPKEQA